MHARVGVIGLPLGTARAEFRKALFRIRNQIDSAGDFALRSAPQLQIALIEAGENCVYIRAPGMLKPFLTIRRLSP